MLEIEECWFSCRIRFVHYSNGNPSCLIRTSSYLLKARDFEAARLRALEIGRREERIYPNADGGMARTAMIQVEALDMLDGIVDGVEVASLWSDEITPCPYPWEHQFAPEESRPTNSL